MTEFAIYQNAFEYAEPTRSADGARSDVAHERRIARVQ